MIATYSATPISPHTGWSQIDSAKVNDQALKP